MVLPARPAKAGIARIRHACTKESSEMYSSAVILYALILYIYIYLHVLECVHSEQEAKTPDEPELPHGDEAMCWSYLIYIYIFKRSLWERYSIQVGQQLVMCMCFQAMVPAHPVHPDLEAMLCEIFPGTAYCWHFLYRV